MLSSDSIVLLWRPSSSSRPYPALTMKVHCAISLRSVRSVQHATDSSKVDDYRILLDCGWDERFDVTQLEPLARYRPFESLILLPYAAHHLLTRHSEVKQINCVLLSHPDLAHLGAFPYVYGKLGLRCPVYATSAVVW